MAANKAVLLGDVITDCKSADILGISDRTKIIRYIERAIEIIEYKTNWTRYIAALDVCSGCDGTITLPSFVDTVLAVNIAGWPAYPRNGWYEYHLNGSGSSNPMNGTVLPWVWDDKGWSPTIQDLSTWSVVAAIVEDPTDGDGSLSLRVFGETADSAGNPKVAQTTPTQGVSSEGVIVPLINGYASMDVAATRFKRITRVIKPVTRGYVKLIGFTGVNGENAVTLGYYGPRETQPAYRRIRVGRPNTWCRIRYRTADCPLINDYDIIPLPSRQGLLDLVKAIRLRETNNIDVAETYEAKATQLFQDIQAVEDGPMAFQVQVDPLFGIGTVDWR